MLAADERHADAPLRSASIFGRTTNLYVNDRCFVPRRVCKVHVWSAGATLLLPRDGPSTVTLMPKQYDVVLGAAQREHRGGALLNGGACGGEVRGER